MINRRARFPKNMDVPRLNVLVQGGMGDVILVTPSIRQWKKNHPNGIVTVLYVADHHKEVFEANPFVDRLEKVENGSDFAPLAARFAGEIKRTDYGRHFRKLTELKPAQELIASMMHLELDDSRPELFLTSDELARGRNRLKFARRAVVFHTTPACSENKAWPTENWLALIQQMREFTFFQIGAKDEFAIPGAVNLLGGSFRESFAVLASSEMFVGIDSVFAHAAAALGVPAVVLFGASSHELWGHGSARNLRAKIACSPCIGQSGHHNCAYDRACMKMITPLTVAQSISSLITQKPTHSMRDTTQVRVTQAPLQTDEQVSRVRYAPDIAVHLLDPLRDEISGPRLHETSGVRQVSGHEIRRYSYLPDSWIPLNNWKPITANSRSFDKSVLEPEFIHANRDSAVFHFCLSSDALVRLSRLISAYEAHSKFPDDVREMIERQVSSYLVSRFRIVDNVHSFRIQKNAPGLPTVTTDHRREGLRNGLHIDSWDGSNYLSRSRSRTRFSVNLGPGERFFLFCPYTLPTLFKISGQDVAASREFVLNPMFFERNQQISVRRLSLRPGEGYIAMTDQLIHDGSTEQSAIPAYSFQMLGMIGSTEPI